MTNEDIPTGAIHIGATSTANYFLLERIVISSPTPGTIDDLASAVENRRWQQAYAQENGPFGLVVVVDRLAAQDREARATYAEMTPDTLHAVALVTRSLLARAIASFFFGMSRPAVTYRTFDRLETAIDWLQRKDGT